MIYSKLHSDILFRGKKYTLFGSNNYKYTIPIFQLYDDWDGSPLLLLGEGGQGKTTNSKILQAELLYRQIPCFVFDSRQINSGFLKFTDAYPRDSVIIFDGWYEVF